MTGPIELPKALRGTFFKGRWETRRIWQLTTPVRLFTLAELEWHLDLTVWSTVPGESLFDLAPRTVLRLPETYQRHWKKIAAAELKYPLEMFRQGSRWVVVDGYHRLARHGLETSREIPVRLHPDECWKGVRVDS